MLFAQQAQQGVRAQSAPLPLTPAWLMLPPQWSCWFFDTSQSPVPELVSRPLSPCYMHEARASLKSKYFPNLDTLLFVAEASNNRCGVPHRQLLYPKAGAFCSDASRGRSLHLLALALAWVSVLRALKRLVIGTPPHAGGGEPLLRAVGVRLLPRLKTRDWGPLLRLPPFAYVLRVWSFCGGITMSTMSLLPRVRLSYACK